MVAEVSSVSFSVVEVGTFRFDVLVVRIATHNCAHMFHCHCVALDFLMPEYVAQNLRQIVF